MEREDIVVKPESSGGAIVGEGGDEVVRYGEEEGDIGVRKCTD